MHHLGYQQVGMWVWVCGVSGCGSGYEDPVLQVSHTSLGQVRLRHFFLSLSPPSPSLPLSFTSFRGLGMRLPSSLLHHSLSLASLSPTPLPTFCFSPLTHSSPIQQFPLCQVVLCELSHWPRGSSVSDCY